MWLTRWLALALSLAVAAPCAGCGNSWGPSASGGVAGPAEGVTGAAPRERRSSPERSSDNDSEKVAFGSREWWAMKERDKSTAR
jgi:hypothetical protein